MICFDPGSSTSPGGVDAYLIRVTCSTANCATLYVSSGTNLAREVVTTTTAAPGSGDVPIINVGLHTGAGTSTSTSVTMNDVSGTSYGSTTPPASIIVGDVGVWVNGTTAATAYTFKHKGVFFCGGGGQVSVGTSGTRVPSGSSATYTADVASNVDSGWVRADGCTWNAYGRTMASTITNLTSNVAAAGTVIAVTSTADWAVSDVLAFGSTTTTSTQSENKTVLTVDSATGATMTAGLTNAHSGTSPTQGFVGNLTRNVKFIGTSSSLQGYLFNGPTAIVNESYVELSFMGSGTANKRGYDIQTTTGTTSVTNSSLHDFTAANSFIYISTGTSSNITFSTNVVYSHALGFTIDPTSGTWTMNGNLFMKQSTTNTLGDVGGTFTNNVISSNSAIGLTMTEAANLGTFSGNTLQSNNSDGGRVTNNLTTGITTPWVITNTTSWRNNSWGWVWLGYAQNLTMDGYVAFGNNTANLLFNV